MKDILILTDTRQKSELHILRAFDKAKILHLRTTLKTADYMAVRFDEKQGFYLDYSTLIDTKKDLEEIVHNLCNSREHERIKHELEKAKMFGCTNFIFLIANEKIKSAEDLKSWHSTRTQVRGETLLKIMKTMKERYGCRFMFTSKKEMGSKIIELLK